MKRTVYNTMIGLMLVCGLAITSTGAMAQGRRPASTNSAAAAGNRSVATAPKSNAATVTNNNNVSSRSTATSVSTQVNRTSTTSGTRSTSGSSSSTTIRPSVGGSSGSSTSTTRTSGGSNGTSVRNNNGGNHGSSVSTTIINANAGNRSATGSSSTVRTTDNNKNKGNGNVRPNTGNNGGNNNGSVRPNTGNNGSGNVRPNTSGNSGNNNGGHSTAPTRRPDNRPKVKGSVLVGGGPKIDYKTFGYTSNARPRFAGDRFFDRYRYNSWSWAKPIRPSVRYWRPSTIWVYRPIVTVNISSYSSYPTIGGVLGLEWGTSFGNALNYLYYNGYEIDGFMDNIVYLTDVELLDYDWDDVMMQFDGNDNLDYVEFSSWSNTYDTSRFYSLYNYLCSLFGSPVSYSNSMYSWYGGDGIGFVNLGMQTEYGYSYTVLAFGV